jgi:hypothetical protein
VAFEGGSGLLEIGRSAFRACSSLQSIGIPSTVGLLGSSCFAGCVSLGSVTFGRPSTLATIEQYAFLSCRSLNRLHLPASVKAIDGSAFCDSGISSIEIEEGSVSFRVVNEFLVDFEFRSLVLVMGSPESIEIPSSIEEIGPFCCGGTSLRTVEFETDSNLRSIGRSAFLLCRSLESICIPSSVEVLGENCFGNCWSLRTVTFGRESRLRLIENNAFQACRLLESVSVRGSVEVIGCQPIISIYRS